MITSMPNKHNKIALSKDKTKNKKRLSKNTAAIISLFLILSASFKISKNYYITSKSKDLCYAVEYNLTHNHSEKELMRVKCMKLIKRKNNTVIMQASGLSSSVPHKTIFVTASFNKINNTWYLDKIY